MTAEVSNSSQYKTLDSGNKTSEQALHNNCTVNGRKMFVRSASIMQNNLNTVLGFCWLIARNCHRLLVVRVNANGLQLSWYVVIFNCQSRRL